jgi:hypothetical protein
MSSIPHAERQASFVTKLQYLLAEGEFVSTYKYALLLALTRWAVENPDHDEAQPLAVGELAPHFAALYWAQARPFRDAADPAQVVRESAPRYGAAGTHPWNTMLLQDRGGQQSRVLRLLLDEQAQGHASLHALPTERRARLFTEVAKSIRDMPLWRLHLVDGADFRFLYQRGADDDTLVFEPGIVACLVAFAPLIERIVRGAWLEFVLRYNNRLLGAVAQVESFLFPDGRAGLASWRPVLESVQGTRCFYCADEMSEVAVDHFLPWARYPRDLGHNFVLAHARCNGQKRDHLPSVEHLERWCRRNDEQHVAMAEAFDRARLPHDWATLRRAAGSLYHVAAHAGARVWQRQRELVPLDDRWRELLGVG